MDLSKLRNLTVLAFAMLFTCNIYSVEIEEISVVNQADGRVYAVEIDASDTIGDLKNKISEKLGLARNRVAINLVANGKILKNHESVWNLPGIHHENMRILMSFRPR
jgi:hypothetical protein